MAYMETNPQSIWSTQLTANDTAMKEESIGVIRELTDGRVFRYVQMTGGALAAGEIAIVKAVTTISNLTSASGTGPDGATTTIITDSTASFTTDEHIGSYFKVDTGMTGSEEAIKIVANTATTLTLERSISTALAGAGTDDGEIVPPTGLVIISAVDDATQIVSGVGISTIAQNSYGWVQISGLGNVIATSALTETQSVTPGGASTAGQAKDGAGTTDFVIGYTVAAGSTNAEQFVLLSIPR